MSEQIEQLKNIIGMARTGNEGAIKLLRTICVKAAEAAPAPDLLTIGECLYCIGREAEEKPQ